MWSSWHRCVCVVCVCVCVCRLCVCVDWQMTSRRTVIRAKGSFKRHPTACLCVLRFQAGGRRAVPAADRHHGPAGADRRRRTWPPAAVRLFAASSFELAREQRISDLSTKGRRRWLRPEFCRAAARSRPTSSPCRAAAQVVGALRQLVHPKAVNGELPWPSTADPVSLRGGRATGGTSGKWALAEKIIGLVCPDTIIVGVDPERELILGHQLRRSESRSSDRRTGARMNEWQIAAAVLGLALLPCMAVALLAPPTAGLAAVEVGAVLLTTILMLLSEGFHRQPFIDLAVVCVLRADVSLVGSLFFAPPDGAPAVSWRAVIALAAGAADLRRCARAAGGAGHLCDARCL